MSWHPAPGEAITHVTLASLPSSNIISLCAIALFTPEWCGHLQEKHWRCTDCRRKMHSAAALQVHSSQVHKINLSA